MFCLILVTLTSFLLLSSNPLFAQEGVESLFRDLKRIKELSSVSEDRLPYHYNHTLMGGYFSMPSARMGEVGKAALGLSYAYPYRRYGATIQLLNRLEFGIGYQVFIEIPDQIMGKMGFGDFSDRGANLKIGILREREGGLYLPEVAVGLEDFYGTKRFFSFYVVATKQLLKWDLETTLGWGKGRIRGFFGGISWTPFRKTKNWLVKDLSFLAEYDGIDYKGHSSEHPKARRVKSPLNLGLSTTLFDFLQLNVSSLRGEKIAASAAFFCNFGSAKGLFPKSDDPSFYKAPVDREPIGYLRSKKELAQELAFAFADQGIELNQAYLTSDQGQNHALWLSIVNTRYRSERALKKRAALVLAALMPENIGSTRLVVKAAGIPTQEYHFRSVDLQKFFSKKITHFEFQTLSPMRTPTEEPSRYDGTMLYHRRKKTWICTIRPRFLTFFGSATGKFKYSVGLLFGPEGYLFDSVYYKVQAALNLKSSLSDVGDRDMLNPSQIINVRSDMVRYYRTGSFSIEQAYLQKASYLKSGWYGRLAMGYFEVAYGGGAAELLYSPACSNWAIGLEIATLFKRKYHGIGFTTKINRFDGVQAKKYHYIGHQFFVDLYCNLRPFPFDFKMSFGKFLARDIGVRFELSRHFASGLKVSAWYTWTNARDIVNQSRHQDKGIAFVIPLDFFLKKSSRKLIPYAMSVWLRDTGARAKTGRPLYPIIQAERFSLKRVG